jgi:hypothetical protein
MSPYCAECGYMEQVTILIRDGATVILTYNHQPGCHSGQENDS